VEDCRVLPVGSGSRRRLFDLTSHF
jgi:hypothetical protein